MHFYAWTLTKHVGPNMIATVDNWHRMPLQGCVSIDSVQHDYLLALLGSKGTSGSKLSSKSLSNSHFEHPPSTSGAWEIPLCKPMHRRGNASAALFVHISIGRLLLHKQLLSHSSCPTTKGSYMSPESLTRMAIPACLMCF